MGQFSLVYCHFYHPQVGDLGWGGTPLPTTHKPNYPTATQDLRCLSPQDNDVSSWEEAAAVLIFQNYIFILAYGSPKSGNQLLPLKSLLYFLPIANRLHFIQYVCCELWLEYTDFIEERYARSIIQTSTINTCINYLVLLGNNKKREGKEKVSVYFLLILPCSFGMC